MHKNVQFQNIACIGHMLQAQGIEQVLCGRLQAAVKSTHTSLTID